MEVVNFLLLTAILVIILVNNSSIKDRIEKLRKDINYLQTRIGISSTPTAEMKKKEQPEPLVVPEKKPILTDEETVSIINQPSISDLISAEPKKVSVEQPAESRKTKVEEPIRNIQKPVKHKVKGDLEKFIGENLMSKIGIIILVLGIGYFVKYAIDKDYINEYGRTAIGFLVGGGIIALAHKMRKDYKTFASILIGGGLAILYTTVTIAYQLYKVIPNQALAFAVLIVITIFAVILSLLYDKKELAIFSLIGGFASPFMVTSGSGNYIVLFSYLLILNAGMVVIAWYKRWNILNLLGYIFTIILFGGWLVDAFMWKSESKPIIGAIIFATLFYLGFFLVNILNNIRKLKPFNGIEIGMILSNNLFYFLCGLLIFDSLKDGMYKGLFTVLVGIYNFLWVLYLYKKDKIDKTLVFLLIGLVLSFISLAIPIQLKGHSITLFWAAELVILLWISQVSGIKMLKTGHLVILGLTTISLLMDWNNGYSEGIKILPILFNQVCITGLVVVTAIGLSIYLLKEEKEPVFIKHLLDVKPYSVFLSVFLFVSLYAVLYYELVYQMNRYFEIASFRHVVYGIFNFTYLAVFLLFCKWQQWVKVEKLLYYISLFLLFIFMVYYSHQIVMTRNNYLFYNLLTEANYLFHYLIYPAITGILYFIIVKRDEVFKSGSLFSKAALWFATFFMVVTASIELDNMILYLNKADFNTEYNLLRQVHMTGYAILWACMAFILMFAGMKVKNKIFRIQAIALLGLIILKILLYDFWQMNAGGRIATFISLGIILLVISFLYQKLKKLILDSEEKEPIN
jgi:uncharacterized membrane protein